MATNLTVQTGFWVNHDYPPAQGATLTIPIRWGNYLIAALSSLVAWAGASAWNICAYCLHQRFASKREKDVLDQQLQVLLRGSTTAFDALCDALDLHSAWKKRAGNSSKRILPLAGFAFAVIVTFAAAGIFVAEVASKTYQDVLVLAAPRDCGNMQLAWKPNATPEERNSMIATTQKYYQEKYQSSREYANSYYGESSKFVLGTPFVHSKLPIHASPVPCPFGGDGRTRCLGPNLTEGHGWSMDSGVLDSHVHFGINAPAVDRVGWRKLATCAVVDPDNFTTTPFSKVEEIAGTILNTTYVGIKVQDGDWSPTALGNVSFVYNMNQQYDTATMHINRVIWQARDVANYSLSAPLVQTFNRTDADVALLLLYQSKRLAYTSPILDPFFLATQRVWIPHRAEYEYHATNPFSLMACFDSYQMCNPGNNRCGEIDGIVGFRQARFDEMGFNSAQRATALRFVQASWLGAQFAGNTAYGAYGLQVVESTAGGGGPGFREDQWTREVERWFATTLASMQDAQLDWISKPWAEAGHPPDPNKNISGLDAPYVAAGVKAEFDALCSNQLIRAAAGMQNFSVTATVVVIVLSTAVIIVGATLPGCVRRARQRRARKGLSALAERRQLARAADGKYHLLRLALEGAGIEEWEAGKKGIPVTAQGEVVSSPQLDGGLARFPTRDGGLARRGTGMTGVSVKDIEKSEVVETGQADRVKSWEGAE